jgi:inorganic pyrophosphatase
VVRARCLGVLRVEQRRDGGPPKRNDRLLVVPRYEHRNAHLRDIADLPERVLDEIESFVHASLHLTGKSIELKGWASASEALELVRAAAARFDSAADS